MKPPDQSDAKPPELLQAIRDARDVRMADLLTLVIGIAAEQNPAELRMAIGKVFSLGALDESLARLHMSIARAQGDLRDLHVRIKVAEEAVEKLLAREADRG